MKKPLILPQQHGTHLYKDNKELTLYTPSEYWMKSWALLLQLKLKWKLDRS